MSLATALNLVAFAGLLFALSRLREPRFTLPGRILAGLLAGIGFGLALQLLYSSTDTATISQTLTWTNVVGRSYINLLRMIIMPLVLVMMIAAVVRMREVAVLGRIGGLVIGVLVVTTVIAALVGVGVSAAFGLSAEGLTEGERELARAQSLERRQESIADLGLADILIRFVPSNVFYDLTGARSTSIIAVVVFGLFFGVACLLVAREDERKAGLIYDFVETAQAVIMKLVRLVMLLTPFGILALMTRVVAGSNAADIVNLAVFIVASYVAMIVMFGIHLSLLVATGVKTRDYLSKAWPALAFAFSSRSSAASIPINVETQIEKLAVPAPVANLAASFGATIGQNGCAGIYPAMLATMIAPTVGLDPLSPGFLASLVLVVAIGSFGVAGVGGGATMSALIVLPAMGLPVALAALLISIEPLIDMARTALNVNGSMLAGLLATRFSNVEQTEKGVERPPGPAKHPVP